MKPSAGSIPPSPSLTAFIPLLTQGNSFLLEGLSRAAKAHLAYTILKETGRSIVLITGNAHDNSLFEDCSFFCPDATVEFPGWETFPGEKIGPSPDLLGKRFETFWRLTQRKKPSILLSPLSSLLQKVVPAETLSPLLSVWKQGTVKNFSRLQEELTSLGYVRAPVVSDKGEFALRGGIVDIFPISASDPYRIEWLDDKIDTIRIFDPVGQRCVRKVEEMFLSPAQEFPLLQKACHLVLVSTYLGSHPIFLWDDLVQIEDTYTTLMHIPKASSLFFYSFAEFVQKTKSEQHVFCAPQSIEDLSVTASKGKRRDKYFAPLSFDTCDHHFEAMRFFHPYCATEPLEEVLANPDLSFLFIHANDTEKKEIEQKITAFPKHSRFATGFLSAGVYITDAHIALIPHSEITHKHTIRRQKWRSTYHTPAAEFHTLLPGDLVVHFHSGIGRYLGTKKHTDHLGKESEFLILEYAEGSKLFVPIAQAYLVSRYIGSKEESPPLSILGGKRWHATRMQAQAQIVGYANELLQLYAERALKGGFAYPPDSTIMRQFEADFPYAETEDQLRAIEEIKQDMVSQRSMDRLICGDVGYGKTEVAMRAAFKAIVDGHKQVAVLVPTTVLAMQHYETFCERMENFPVRLDVVSRFRSTKEIKAVLQNVSEGKIDLLIGTHRLLSSDVHFRDLGLIIIDEEQRFGVRSKEHLKKLKIGVDCLTLSATPIPRTLYMSLVHARDMSVISTPPQDRLPVQTIIAENDPELIQNALRRELARGGQVFYIHNRIESIYAKAEIIQKLLPMLRIGVVHGQMDSDAIDKIFHVFKKGELDLLCTTTIIENGVDIPNANTILIDRADTYGLADLYQLRGRVGRWNRPAYAYFLVARHTSLPEQARKRLNALAEASGYGGGMKIAMRDLEIRGAGDILGVQQSGQIAAVGFHLYCKLLKRAIDSLKKQRPISFNETKMEFSYDASLPDFYINEFALRMEMYYRLGEATQFQEVDDLFAEIKDRFGSPPPQVLWLYHLNRIRIVANSHHVAVLHFQDRSFTVEYQKEKNLEKKTFILPKSIQTPEALEKHVLSLL